MHNGRSTSPPCREACPAGIDVPRYIRHIRDGAFDRALAVILEKIPFPAVCGYACVHPCEAKCARAQYDEPVAIRLLKRAAAEYGREAKAKDGNLATTTGKKVAVVGAGPCGLTAAYYLAGMGHGVTVFEAMPSPGGMLRYGIPAYRLPKDVLDREIAQVTRRGVEIRTGTAVTEPARLPSEGYDAVLVTVGAWQGRKMGIAGEDAERVLDGIKFLQTVNEGNRPHIGHRVVVVGGGNTALDAARAAVRLGAGVTVLYRRTMAHMPADPEEVRQAAEEGVQFKFLAAPVKLEAGNLVCQEMVLGASDDSGRPTPVPVEDGLFSLPCDTVIAAVGQVVDSPALGLEAGPGGTIRVDSTTFATAQRGIFAAGDAVTGPSSIIQAIAQGRLASAAVDKYLGGPGRLEQPAAGTTAETSPEEAPRGTGRQVPGYMPAAERCKNFAPVECGYDRDQAMTEAQRCLACDLRQYRVEVNFDVCKGCSYCREVCSLDVFDISASFNAQGYRPAQAARTDRCVGCLRCLYVCPDFAIDVRDACESTIK